MKKLLALLMACATMTFAFASCGNDEGSESESESSVSESSEEETTEETTEEVTEEETTEEETTEEETDETDTLDDEDEETIDTIEKTTYEFIEDADMTAFLGKWEGEKMVFDGEEVTELMGLPLYAICQLEIKDDGTAVMGEPLNEMSDAEVAVTYKWGVISDTEMAIIIEDGNDMLFTLDGDYLVGTEEGDEGQIYCRRVEEFTPFDFESFVAEFQEGLEDIEIVTDFESEDSVIGDSEEELADPPVDTEDSVAE